MPILNWIGKEKIVNHDKDVPFRLLAPKESASHFLRGKQKEEFLRN